MKLRRGKNLRRNCRITKRGMKKVHCNIWSCFLSGLLQLPSLWMISNKLKYQCDLDGEIPEHSVVITFCGCSYRVKPQVLFHGQKRIHFDFLKRHRSRQIAHFLLGLNCPRVIQKDMMTSWGCSLHSLLHSYFVLYESSLCGALTKSLCLKQDYSPLRDIGRLHLAVCELAKAP